MTNVKLVLQLHFATWTNKISALFFWGVKRSNVYTLKSSLARLLWHTATEFSRDLSHRRRNLCSHLPLRYGCSALATLCSTVADNDDDDKCNNCSSTNFCKLYAPTFNSSAHNYLLTTIHNVNKSWQCVNYYQGYKAPNTRTRLCYNLQTYQNSSILQVICRKNKRQQTIFYWSNRINAVWFVLYLLFSVLPGKSLRLSLCVRAGSSKCQFWKSECNIFACKGGNWTANNTTKNAQKLTI